jgi:hypothetical protein
MPADAVRPVCLRMCARIYFAVADAVRTRDSTIDVEARARTNTSSAQWRMAGVDGMAERTPNARAS